MSNSTNLEAATTSKHGDGGVLGGVGDFFHAAAYGAIQSPIDGITQIADHLSPVHLPHLDLISKPDHDSLWTSAGKLTGAVVDFALLQKGLGTVTPGVFGAEATSPIWLRSGMTGAAYQMMMPVNGDGNYFANKAKEVGIGFGTFAVMGAITEKMAPRMGKSLLGRVETGAEGGLAGGTADAALTDLLYLKKPDYKDLYKVANYTAFGAMLGATSYFEDAIKAKWKTYTGAKEQVAETKAAPEVDPKVQQSIEANQEVFKQSGNDVVTTQKQLYDVSFRKVTAPEGEKIVTLENSGGETVKQGQWIAQRLDAQGQPVYERGQLNQWPITEGKILKTYNVDPNTLSSQTEFVAPTKVGGAPVHMVQLKEPLTSTRPGDRWKVILRIGWPITITTRLPEHQGTIMPLSAKLLSTRPMKS